MKAQQLHGVTPKAGSQRLRRLHLEFCKTARSCFFLCEDSVAEFRREARSSLRAGVLLSRKSPGSPRVSLGMDRRRGSSAKGGRRSGAQHPRPGGEQRAP